MSMLLVNTAHSGRERIVYLERELIEWDGSAQLTAILGTVILVVPLTSCTAASGGVECDDVERTDLTRTRNSQVVQMNLVDISSRISYGRRASGLDTISQEE